MTIRPSYNRKKQETQLSLGWGYSDLLTVFMFILFSFF